MTPKTLALCDCSGSQSFDSTALQQSGKLRCTKVFTGLCTHQSDTAADLIQGGDLMIACQQERAFFEQLAAEADAPLPSFVDLRDRAGWSDEADRAAPKMAALLADALRPADAVKTMDIFSDGMCLLLGAPEVTLPAAEALSEHLSVTVLMETDTDLPLTRSFDVIKGALRAATGSLGQFEVRVDRLQQLQPGGRGAFGLTDPRDGGTAECDVIVDLRKAPSLFPAPEKRDGYFRADPGSSTAVATAIRDASHMVGTFEKPLYLSLSPLSCAHSRAQQNGCSNCLNICPTGAIVPDGEAVDIDPNICAGCGACAALCPSGAITFDAPTPQALFSRMSTLAEAYRDAGGRAPRLLVHDAHHGAELISLSARFDRGLPHDVIPLELEKTSGFGHAEILAALASGFVGVDVLCSPTTEAEALTREVALARALAVTPSLIRVLEPHDPAALSDALYQSHDATPIDQPILPLGSRRQVTRLAVQALHGDLEAPLPLPENAPYGAVLVDTETCTLCLSCASLCPSGALGDNPDMPQLRFQEDACLQCGLCSTVCPENAISLVPQFDSSAEALQQKVVHEEEPFCCVSCGKPFGVKSTIEKIVEKLEGNHAMFDNPEATNLIKMCDDCRVNAQYHMQNNPLSGKERPRVRTTDDYFSDRRDH